MIKVTFEMIPHGLLAPEEFGTLEIVNTVDHPDRPTYGNYRATLRINDEQPREIRLQGHRRVDGFVPLLRRIMEAFG